MLGGLGGQKKKKESNATVRETYLVGSTSSERNKEKKILPGGGIDRVANGNESVHRFRIWIHREGGGGRELYDRGGGPQ